MSEKARAHDLVFRPHFKTHQSRVVGRMFRDAGVSRIAVSSLRMAAYFADDGWEDIAVAFPVNLREIDAVNALAARVRLQLLVESADTVRRLCQGLRHEVGMYVKIDAGYGRTGIAHDDLSAAEAVCAEIARSPQLRLHGLLAHAGDSYHAGTPDAVRGVFNRTRERITAAADALRPRHPGLIVSVGDTPGCALAEDFTGIDEIRPGNFVFFDVMQMELGACAAGDIAVALAAPVVAVHPERREFVMYAGGVHLSKEQLPLNDGDTYCGKVVLLTDEGWSPPLPDTHVVRLSQEHGVVRSTPEIIDLLHPGALVGVLPVHSCLAAECMRGYLMLDGRTADHCAGQPFTTVS
jgi:D-serine deaminase-like pyridoxal phosphate-dependent protein